NYLTEIHIDSVNNEVIEILWFLKKDYSEKIGIKTVNFLKKEDQYFEGIYTTEPVPATLSLPLKYLYEPNPAIMTSGLFAEVGTQTETSKLNVSSHLYTSNSLVDFPGRRSEITDVVT